jgi:hypothetical protein
LQYHPDRNPDDEEASVIFQRVGEAYVALCDPDAIVVEEEVCEIVLPMTSEAAKKAYEKKFGKYRDLYYSDGAIIGLLYSFDLQELLEMTERERQCSSFRLGNFRISLIRAWLIKRHLSLTLLLCETILTWMVVAFCKLQYSFVCFYSAVYKNTHGAPCFLSKGTLSFLLDDDRLINVIGGVALLSAQFVLYFWYGKDILCCQIVVNV